ncbi:MAG: hypothetical protein IJ650_05170 [Paludibacteraceae bacterium]|nr:hypothetical protein [Paludibacteraceae bacterium]
MKQRQTDINTEADLTRVSNAVFYLPFAYNYSVRLRTPGKLLSWMLIYLMPTGWYSWLAAGGVSWLFCINYLLILVAAFTLYEIGYIHNDTFATLREQKPTLRLSEKNSEYFYSHAGHIFFARVTIAAILLTVFLLLNDFSAGAIVTTVSTGLIPIVFLIYNRWRNRWNVLLYPILVFSRYLPFLLPYSPSWQIYMLLFLSFPCCNMLERFSMPSYRFPVIRKIIPTESSKTYFRVGYYAIALALLLPFFGIRELIPLVILGSYRCVVALLLQFYSPKRYLK